MNLMNVLMKWSNDIMEEEVSLYPYENMELVTLDYDGFVLRRYFIQAKKHGGLKINETE